MPFPSLSSLLPKKKLKAKGLLLPSYLRKVKTGANITDERRNSANEDLTKVRTTATSSEEVIREFLKKSPDVSHAKESIMRCIITDRFTLVAKNLVEGTIDPEATKAAQLFASRINNLPAYPDVFSPQTSLASLSESLVSQLCSNGSCAAEVVVDQTMLPSFFRGISTNNLQYQSAGDRVVPYIKDTGDAVSLDSPAVCIISLSQDLETPYAESWFKAAIQSILSSTEFTNDLRRSFRKASLPRVKAVVDFEEFKQSLPPDVQYDTNKLQAECTKLLDELESRLNGLNPEDAVVNFDMIDIDHLTAGNASNHENVTVHAGIINGQLSNGLHVLPSILGRGESQTTASTETVLFLKVVESLQGRLNELYSRLFTVAMRLHGYDVTVDFRYKKPSLRTENEDESFVAMRQSRILELLSLGLISDEEASLELTGDLPSGDFKPLSGTGFRAQTANTADNPYSNTSVGGKQLDNTKDQKDRSQGNSKPKSNKTAG